MDDLYKINLAIIGAGRWGFNHVRTAINLLPPENILVCDISNSSLQKIKQLNPSIDITNDINEIIKRKDINAVIVATPAETHFAIAKLMLENNKNVLVEKPITLELTEAKELDNISNKAELKLMVGHVILYHPAIVKIKEEIKKNTIGKLQYIYSNRLNLGAIRSEENILWSFAPHDISIIQYLTESFPYEISANGASFIQNKIEDTTLTYLKYPGGINAHIFVSWLNPFKEQRMVVIGEDGMFVFEDTLPKDKLKFYKKGFKNNNGVIEKFDDNYQVVPIENKMPLTEEHIHFYKSILNNTQPYTDGKHAVEVLRILVEATKSLKNSDMHAIKTQT